VVRDRKKVGKPGLQVLTPLKTWRDFNTKLVHTFMQSHKTCEKHQGGANGGSEIVKIWKDYFKGILNSEDSANESAVSVWNTA